MSFESPFERIKPGDTTISSQDFNRAFAAVRNLSAAAGVGNLIARQSITVGMVDVEPPELTIRITGVGSGDPVPYSWEEVVEGLSDLQEPTFVPTGRGAEWHELPARELNRNAAVPIGTVVRAREYPGFSELTFQFESGSGAPGPVGPPGPQGPPGPPGTGTPSPVDWFVNNSFVVTDDDYNAVQGLNIVITAASVGGIATYTIATTASPTFIDVTITNNLTVGGDINLGGALTGAFPMYHRGTTDFEAWYPAGNITGATPQTAPFTLPADQMYAVPLPLPSKITLDRLGIYISGIGSPSSSGRLGIYKAKTPGGNGNHYPGELVFDAGTVGLDTLGPKSVTLARTLSPGLYFLVFLPESGCDVAHMAGDSQWSFGGSASDLVSETATYVVGLQGFGALPQNFPAMAPFARPVGGLTPAIFFRASA